MVATLMEISLDNICLNLSYNYELCSRLSIRIPAVLGQLIFNNSFTVLPRFRGNDLKFFSLDILSLNKVDLLENQFSTVENFDFLDGHSLLDFSIGDIRKFKVTNPDFKITTKCLYVGDLNVGIKADQIDFILSRCKVTERVNFMAPKKNFKVTDSICTLLNNASDSLQTFDGTNIDIFVSDMEFFRDFLLKKTKLNKLKWNVCGRLVEGNVDNTEKKYELIGSTLRAFPKTLTSLDLYLQPDHRLIFEQIPELLKNLPSLNEFFLKKMPLEEELSANILKALHKFNSQKLTEIILHFDRIDVSSSTHLPYLVQHCKSLKKITIECYHKPNELDHKIIDALNSSAQHLEQFFIEFNGKRSVQITKSFENLLPNCSSLKFIEVGVFGLHNVNFDCIAKCLVKSRNSLEEVNLLESQYGSSISTVCNGLKNLRNLQNITIISLDFFDSFTENLCSSLRYSVDTLTCIKLFDCNLIENDGKIIGDLLKHCRFLQVINLSSNGMLSSGLKHIIDGLFSSKDTLSHINLSRCGMTDTEGYILANFLRYCTQIIAFRLCKTILSGDCLKELLRCLRAARKSLRILDLYQCPMITSVMEDVKILANGYYQLDEFGNGERF